MADRYRILEFSAENFKRLKFVTFKPKGRITTLSGKNDQGKSSVLDAVMYAFGGAKAAPEMPMRKGASKMEVKLDLGTLIARRTGTKLEVTPAKGEKAWNTPQRMLDSIYEELAFNPQEFALMDAESQAEALHKVAGVDEELKRLDKLNDEDYKARTPINLEAKRLAAEITGMVVQDGLPKEKIDDTAILTKIQEVDAINLKARQVDQEKRDAEAGSGQLDRLAQAAASTATAAHERLEELQRQVEQQREKVVQDDLNADRIRKQADDAVAAAALMPQGEFADVMALTKELQQAQLVNREIDKRNRRAELEAQKTTKERESRDITRRMEEREEEKRLAIVNAALPLPGLTVDGHQVLYNGIPVKQLGEARQILLGVAIGIARDPKLRLALIPHGEALDEDALAELAQMAEEKDFYVWMAKVDSSGKLGIVIEDGMIASDNQEE